MTELPENSSRSGDHSISSRKVTDDTTTPNTANGDAISESPPQEVSTDQEIGEIELTKEDREKLFQESQILTHIGQSEEAFEINIRCLCNMSATTSFPSLPLCLRSVADHLCEKEEFERAIHFVQAEKMFYEAALLDNDILQKRLRESAQEKLGVGLKFVSPSQPSPRSSSPPLFVNPSSPDSMRADEYQGLAEFCLDKKQHGLALEYAAKATQLRQRIFGPDHAVTGLSLDFLAKIYIQAGESDYSDSLLKFTEDALAERQTKLKEQTPESTVTRHTQSILKSPNNHSSTPKNSHSSRFTASSPTQSSEKKRVRFSSKNQVTQIESVQGLEAYRRGVMPSCPPFLLSPSSRFFMPQCPQWSVMLLSAFIALALSFVMAAYICGPIRHPQGVCRSFHLLLRRLWQS